MQNESSFRLLKTYQRRLTNLSGKNRSLWLPRIYKGAFLDISDTDFLLNQAAFSLVERLIEGKKSISICKVADSRDSKSNQVSRQLRQINRQTNAIFEESGAYDLYVGYPFVEGKFQDDTLVRCPLLFFPVRLENKSGKWQITQRREAEVSFNKVFLLAYAHFNEVKVDEKILEENFEEFPRQMLPFLTQLYDYLTQADLELHFNASTFEQKIQPFFSQRRAEATNLFQTGKLKLMSQAVLGIFPQAGSYLYQDYEKLIQNPDTPDLENFFHGDWTGEAATQQAIREEELFAPFDLDASQEQVLRAVKENHSFVVQGPPGTGKSQLICNLVSDFMARGKRVLVVCQKRAALDVVYERLETQGIAQFTALVHDFKQDRSRLYELILNHIQNVEQYQNDNNSLDVIQLERSFLQVSREIEELVGQFEEHKKTLFDQSVCGRNPKEMYLGSTPLNPHVSLSCFTEIDFSDKTYPVFIKSIKALIPLQNEFDKQSDVLFERKSIADFNAQKKAVLLSLFEEVPAFKQKMITQTKQLLGKEISYHQIKKWAKRVPEWQNGLQELEENQIWNIWKASRFYEFEVPEWLTDSVKISDQENANISYAQAELEWLERKKKDLLSYFDDGGMENTLPHRFLKEAKVHLEEYKKQRKSFLRRVWKKVSAPKAAQFSQSLIADYSLDKSLESVETLLQKIDKRNSFELKMIGIQAVEWVAEKPSSIKMPKESLEHWFEQHQKAIRLKMLFIDIAEYSRIFQEKNITTNDVHQFLQDFVSILSTIEQEEKKWQQYLSDTHIELLLEEEKTVKIENRIKTIKEAFTENFEEIVELDTIKSSFSEAETRTIDEVKSYFDNEELNEESFLRVLTNSLQLAWLAKLENEFPILKKVSQKNWERQEKKLQKLIEQKKELSQNILKVKAKERTHQDLTFNRLGNRTSYRELEHQVKKKRSIWALRKLLTHFSDEIFQLLPCWLASPETVSAIFPLEQNFDLVIFDEASQCFAEKGIPALYRAKQSIVAGDEKQLSPHDLYQARYDTSASNQDDDEDLDAQLDLEVDSLLDLAKNYLPSHQLLGHYRSHYPELIAFSNQEFYQNKLQVVPDLTVSSDRPPIEYHKVAGQWHQNQNEEEAQHIKNLVKELVKNGQKDIGIITFNHKQQNLIRDELEEAIPDLPDSIFIKNIENVQGDEREIIIFSVGYAPNYQGRFRLNFGSLSHKGGENRLNVAISRAKEKIYLVSSIFPSHLPVEEKHSTGAQLLKKYLEYAYQISEGTSWHHLATSYQEKSENPFGALKLRTVLKSHFEGSKDIGFAKSTFSVMDEGILHSKNAQYVPLAALHTDDELYHSLDSVKAFYAYLPRLLKQKGWEVYQEWSRNYWKNPEETIQKMEGYLK